MPRPYLKLKTDVQARRLIGKTITGVYVNRQSDGRGGWTTSPQLFLSDGTSMLFDVAETEGDYGVEILLIEKRKKT